MAWKFNPFLVVKCKLITADTKVYILTNKRNHVIQTFPCQATGQQAFVGGLAVYVGILLHWNCERANYKLYLITNLPLH